jgi:hypothetical protein
MTNTTGRILKSSEVNLQGRVVLDNFQTPQNAAGAKVRDANSQLFAAPKARVIQNCAEFAIIEITCPCGTKTNVKCEYNTSSAK